ncbi:MAG TPA: hypothetical protein VL651_16245 [Bacteroidia bacterium]|jgi:hypothetical protein|nr:hypothetical protein [Bacteroidia bacterium]
MKVSIIVKEINPSYSQELADKHHNGEETEDNYKYNWEDEFEIAEEVSDFRILNNTVYKLEGMKDGEKFSYDIASMTVIECETKSGVSRFAASRSLIKDTKKNIAKDGDVTFYLILKGGKKVVNPMDGIYIAEHDFPIELPAEEIEISGDEEE